MTPLTGQDTPALDECVVDAVDVHAFEVPTDGPEGREQDGTLEWDATTLVLVRVHAGGRTGSVTPTGTCRWRPSRTPCSGPSSRAGRSPRRPRCGS